ncbi:General stress protein 69 [Defluviimonas aquaemixtae]|uniref:General stress protein 69 n=1 Tax=Albidovulum aquaemixtae TaxID=1542388 RepID=A0A2R8B4K5_9RHOB|nr:aldo/keto reductase [Defluviimonas aquaemixtae]SPH17541.1 General stress protein 69 [Defluviimonas aquaemixtae]
MSDAVRPDRYRLGDLEISRVLTGLWQVADIEKGGQTIDPDKGADALQAYAEAGFTTFDMADHYGSSEIIAGRLLSRFEGRADRPLAFTKWCPEPGPMAADLVRAGVQERLDRLGAQRVDLLQFHWWSYQHPGWLDALHELAKLRDEGLIGELGVTNFDAAHLHLALADGVPVLTNQVPFSLLDRRAAGPLANLCNRSTVRLLAYGTLCGGFLSEHWLGQPEPTEITDWSKMKYKRFIDTAGGWEPYQDILKAANEIARKHDVSIANVATRWVLDQTGVAGVIIGARLGESEHMADNARIFSFRLDAEDRAHLDAAFAATRPLPGDCGDEYRKPPFLTASGDLSHHLDAMPLASEATDVPHRPGARRVMTGSEWEEIAGYCRAQRIDDRILVSGTTATSGSNRSVASADAAAQTTFILDKILAALAALGASAGDVVRTRIYLTNSDDVQGVSQAHGRVFGEIKPANTLVVVAKLIGDYRVEIEAEAISRCRAATGCEPSEA